jgi:hypothetical protein
LYFILLFAVNEIGSGKRNREQKHFVFGHLTLMCGGDVLVLWLAP